MRGFPRTKFLLIWFELDFCCCVTTSQPVCLRKKRVDFCKSSSLSLSFSEWYKFSFSSSPQPSLTVSLSLLPFLSLFLQRLRLGSNCEKEGRVFLEVGKRWRWQEGRGKEGSNCSSAPDCEKKGGWLTAIPTPDDRSPEKKCENVFRLAGFPYKVEQRLCVRNSLCFSRRAPRLCR